MARKKNRNGVEVKVFGFYNNKQTKQKKNNLKKTKGGMYLCV